MSEARRLVSLHRRRLHLLLARLLDERSKTDLSFSRGWLALPKVNAYRSPAG